MPQADLEIIARAVDQATSTLNQISRSLANVGNAATGAGSSLGRMMETAAGMATGMLASQAFNVLADGITSAFSSMIGMNAQMETIQTSFGILLSDAAAAGSGVVQSQEDIAGATQGAARSVTDAQQRMSDAAEDHGRAVQALAADFADLQAESQKAMVQLARDLDNSLSDMARSHGRSMQAMRQQLAEYNRDFAEQGADRRKQFAEDMANLRRQYAEQTADRRRALAEEIGDIRKRQAAQATTAPDRFLKEREAVKANAEYLKKAIAEEEAKGHDADQGLLASLRARLAQEEAAQKQTYAQFVYAEKAAADAEVKIAETRYAAEEVKAAATNTKQLALLTERLAEEERKAQESHNRQVAVLAQRIAEEDGEYGRAVADRQAKYAEDVANYRAGEAEKMAALQERQAEETRQYARSVRDAQEAIAKAGEGYATAQGKAAQAAGGAVNQMADMYAQLAEYAGRPLKTAQDRAGAMLEWISAKAYETPFEIPDIEKTVQRLLAYRLNALEFMDTVGNVAAGMSVPLSQVADAFGALATGQMGEAVQRFREFGVNLRDIAGLKFDAQGALVTPTEEALALLKVAMDERFAGMMEAQSKTAKGIISNLNDMWREFLKTMGKPAYDEVKAGLKDVQGILDANRDSIQALAKALGTQLGAGLRAIVPLATGALTGLFDWIESGQALEDFDSASRTVGDIVDYVREIAPLAASALTGVLDWIKSGQAQEDFDAVLLPLQAIVKGVGDFSEGIAGAREDTHKAIDAIKGYLEDLRDSAKPIFDAIVQTAKTALNSVIGLLNTWIDAWNAIQFGIGEIDVFGIGKVGPYTFPKPNIPRIPTLAGGGIVTRPTLAMIGERGAEAVIPLDRGGIGRSVTILVTGNTLLADDRTVARQLARLLKPELDGLVRLTA